MKLNDEMKFKILQEISGNFLYENIPDNWLDMSEKDQESFLENYAWEPIEDMGSDKLFETIDNASISMIRFIEENIV